MLAFFQARLWKSLIWQKFSETGEFDFKEIAFFESIRNQVFKFSKRVPWNIEKEKICYFYKESRTFEFIRSLIFTRRNTKDMEIETAERL